MATIVKAAPGEPVDILLRKFNKKVQMDGILLELKKREFYLKPSSRRQADEQLKRRRGIAIKKRPF